MNNSAKGLAHDTEPEYGSHMDETWADLPDFPGYEVSTNGRLRKWTTVRGKAQPKVYKGSSKGGLAYYTIAGEEFSIDELMRWSFGDEAAEMEAGYDPEEHARELSQYEINEIRMAEGYKPAFEVAEDFRIESHTVRMIWDGE